MEREPEESSLAATGDPLVDIDERFALEDAILDDPDGAGPFGDE